ncbi:hypothetical protein L1987_12890 [Smallanthus sonchifolius]|uniref:Uncharacterized protein n=1 Tax=Smallanthus sonchifolius TaxID=185202 RepID=A0ACB9JEZ8_9ASTR|nr:hypothetical protein L1987_12890 [Smallanthus sonchifolius]
MHHQLNSFGCLLSRSKLKVHGVVAVNGVVFFFRYVCIDGGKDGEATNVKQMWRRGYDISSKTMHDSSIAESSNVGVDENEKEMKEEIVEDIETLIPAYNSSKV